MTLLLLCIKVFFVRIIDVSLGTVRTIVTVKDKRFIAAVIGFTEVLVWFLVAKEAISTTSNSIWIAIAYSLGFATGTYIGAYISGKYIKGNYGLQVISGNLKLVKILRDNGYAVTVIDIKGHDKEKIKYMLFIEIDKKDFKDVERLIKEYDKKAFIVVNETRHVLNGYFKGKDY